MRVHLMEIDHGAFAREVELPEDVDAEKIAGGISQMECSGLRFPRREENKVASC